MTKLDILNREEFVNKLVNLTENISANKTSTSFAINGAWGCGKSFVLDMYEEQLSQIQSEKTATDKYFIIRYNCWEYDYYAEPLVAIVAAMIDIINHKTKLWNDDKKKSHILGLLKAIGTAFLSTTNNAIKDRTGVDIQSVYKTAKSNIDKEEKKNEKFHEYDIYFSFNQALCRLQDLIAELSQDQTIVFMVDELDRCLPEYSIKVLERLHHLTETVENVISVLAIDKEKLQQSVTHLFGFKDSNEYLKKFIKFDVKLDKGIVSEKIMEKYSDYINLFDKNLIEYNDSIEEFMQAAFEDIDPRTQEYLMERALVAHKIVCKSSVKDLSFMCMEITLTILICVHGCDFCNTDSEFHFDKRIFNSNRIALDIPFKSFLINKFNKLNLGMSGSQFSDESNSYYLPEKVTLYGAILFLTSSLYKKRENEIIYYAEEVYDIIYRNITDLKNFAEIINFIN